MGQRAGRGLGRHPRPRRRAPVLHHHAVGTGGIDGPKDGPQVVGILDAVQHDDQRRRRRRPHQVGDALGRRLRSVPPRHPDARCPRARDSSRSGDSRSTGTPIACARSRISRWRAWSLSATRTAATRLALSASSTGWIPKTTISVTRALPPPRRRARARAGDRPQARVRRRQQGAALDRRHGGVELEALRARRSARAGSDGTAPCPSAPVLARTRFAIPRKASRSTHRRRRGQFLCQRPDDGRGLLRLGPRLVRCQHALRREVEQEPQALGQLVQTIDRSGHDGYDARQVLRGLPASAGRATPRPAGAGPTARRAAPGAATFK